MKNRGNRREAIFKDDQDRERLLETLTEVCGKTGWQVHAYCLMRNHFHLVIETPQPNLVVGMKWLLGTYTSRYYVDLRLGCLHLQPQGGARPLGHIHGSAELENRDPDRS